VELVTVAKYPCSGGGCPTIFATEDDMVVVQGYAVSPAEAGIDLPDGELLVRVPRSLVHEGASALQMRH
jgi:hypothetical protein